jgi:hypothetical protein
MELGPVGVGELPHHLATRFRDSRQQDPDHRINSTDAGAQRPKRCKTNLIVFPDLFGIVSNCIISFHDGLSITLGLAHLSGA